MRLEVLVDANEKMWIIDAKDFMVNLNNAPEPVPKDQVPAVGKLPRNKPRPCQGIYCKFEALYAPDDQPSITSIYVLL